MADTPPSMSRTALSAADSRRRTMWGYGLAAVGAMMFSMKGIMIKLAYGTPGANGVDGAVEVDAITILALRMGFALPVYSAIALWVWRRQAMQGRARPNRGTIVIVGLLGLLGYYVASFLDFWGLMFVTAQFERLILFTYPIFVMILGVLFFGSRLNRWGVCALAIAYSGIVLVYLRGDTATGDNVLLGGTLVLGAAFAFAFYQLLAKRQVRAIGGRMFTCIAMIAACLGALTHFTIAGAMDGSLTSVLDLPARIYWLTLAIAFISTIIPSFMLNAALERIGPEAISMMGTLSPVYTIAVAIVLLGEPFGPTDAMGTLLVIGGVALYTLKAR